MIPPELLWSRRAAPLPLVSYLDTFFVYFFYDHAARHVELPELGIKPGPPAVAAQGLDC